VESEVSGVIDLIKRKALYFEGQFGFVRCSNMKIFIHKLNLNYREQVVEKEIPEDMKQEVEERRHELIEHVSNADETLGNMYLGTMIFLHSP
jgi:elongation factor G